MRDKHDRARRRRPGPAPVEQPFLHHLVTCMKAPTVALSGTDGQIRSGGVQGVLCYDRRVLSELVVQVDGHEPVPVGHSLDEADDARFVGIFRHLGNPGADPTVRLERRRRTQVHGIDEHLRAGQPRTTPDRRLGHGPGCRGPRRCHRRQTWGRGGGPGVPSHSPTGLAWADAQTQVSLRASGNPTISGPCLTWDVEIPARTAWEADLTFDVATLAPMPHTFRPPADGLGWDPCLDRWTGGPGPSGSPEPR